MKKNKQVLMILLSAICTLLIPTPIYASNDDAMVVMLAFWLFGFLVLAAMVFYIVMDAPDYGMSRVWALLPVFINFFGLILYFIARSSHYNREEYVKCYRCNELNSVGAKFCTKCGSELQAENRTIYCPNCGTASDAGNLYCEACGTKFGM